MIPDNVNQKFQIHWHLIFSLIEQVPRIEICEMGIDAEYIVDMYNAGLAGWSFWLNLQFP
jgi:hypothetical protein